MRDPDDALRAQLADLDPLRRAEPILNHQHLEAVMTEITHRTDTPTRTPRRWPVAVAAAGLIVAAGVGASVLVNRTPPVAPPASPPAATQTAVPSTPAVPAMTLSVPGADPATLSCMRVEARWLKDAERAFAATVTDLTDTTVTLQITHWFKGSTGATTATLTRPTPDQLALIGAERFSDGLKYLISSDAEGTMAVCGFTGPDTPELRAIYTEAFPG